MVLWCKHSDLVRVLERELAFMKMAMQHERQRAERAIDELLRLQAHAQPVSGPLIPDLPPAMTEIEKLLLNPEFAHAGEIEADR